MKKAKKLFLAREFIFLFAIPVVLTLLIVVVAYLPKWLADDPRYDFVYYSCDGYCYSQDVPVKRDGIWVFASIRDSYDDYYNSRPSSDPVIYRHDVAADKSTEITLSQLNALGLDTSTRSPDGFRLEYSYSSHIFGSNESGTYLEKDSVRFSQNTESEGYRIDDQVLGWVENESRSQ